jgi:hypothetical protein
MFATLPSRAAADSEDENPGNGDLETSKKSYLTGKEIRREDDAFIVERMIWSGFLI